MCPVCGKDNLDVTGRNIGCWSCEADGLTGGDYLRALAREVGCRGDQLYADPLAYLAPYLDRPGARSAAPPEPITEERIDGYVSRLWAERGADALAWLRARRLTDETIREYRLGFDDTDPFLDDAIVIPVYEDGEPVREKRRFLYSDDPKTMNSPGPAKLYPDVPERGALLFVAGELDALIGRQMGLPTVSTTCGAKLPEHLAPAFAGRRVFVMFDVGEDANVAVDHARAVGATVTVIDLGALELPPKGDLNDLYLAGGTAEDVKDLVRRTVTS
jgi:hypothetical protein